MLKRWMLMMIVAAGGIFASMAQETTMIRYTNDVQEVIPEVVDGKPVLIVRGVLADGCRGETIVETMRSGNALFIDLYRAFETQPTCTRALLPFEVVVDGTGLFTLDADATLPHILVVNERVYRVHRAQIEPVPGATLVAPRLGELSRGFLNVETITPIVNEDGTVALRLQGMGNDGCVTPVARAVPHPQLTGEILIEVFDAVDPAAMCAAALTPFDVTIPTDAQLGALNQFRLYGLPFALDPDLSTATQTFVVQLLAIDTVDAEIRATYPDQLVVVKASGTIDGCPQEPGMFLYQIVENMVQLRAARIVPEQQACTMIARPLELSFSIPTRLLPTGTVAIVVNNNPPITVELQ